MQLGNFRQFTRAAFFHKLFRRRVHRRARAFRQFHGKLFFQFRQAFHKFIARQDRGRRHGDVFFRLVPLHELQFLALRHQRFFNHALARGELVADGLHRRRVHLVTLAQQIFDHARVTPREQRVDAFHLRIKPVVCLVADDDGIRHAAGRVADFFGEFGNLLVAGNIFGIADADIFPRVDDFLVHINARDGQRPEEIALAAFVHADARQEQVGIQNRFRSRA